MCLLYLSGGCPENLILRFKEGDSLHQNVDSFLKDFHLLADGKHQVTLDQIHGLLDFVVNGNRTATRSTVFKRTISQTVFSILNSGTIIIKEIKTTHNHRVIYLWLQSFQSKKKKMCKPLSRFPNHRQEETFDAMQQRFSYVFPSLSLSLAKVRMNPAVVTDPAE